MGDGDARGQLGLSAIEAAVGVLLILAVATGFALPVPHPDGSARQLDAYAHDTATALSVAPPRHGGATRLSELTASKARFEREKASLRRRLAAALPANLLFRVETPYGNVGYPRPPGVQVGSVTVPTGNGPVTVEVWYA